MEARLQNLLTDKSLDWEIPFTYNPYELSPYKDYYKRLPEGFIMYINQEPMIEPLKARSFKKLVEFTLARYGIDYLHPCFHLEALQKKLYLLFKNEKMNNVKAQRAREVLENETTFKKLVDDRIGEIDKFFSKESMSGIF